MEEDGIIWQRGKQAFCIPYAAISLVWADIGWTPQCRLTIDTQPHSAEFTLRGRRKDVTAFAAAVEARAHAVRSSSAAARGETYVTVTEETREPVHLSVTRGAKAVGFLALLCLVQSSVLYAQGRNERAAITWLALPLWWAFGSTLATLAISVHTSWQILTRGVPYQATYTGDSKTFGRAYNASTHSTGSSSARYFVYEFTDADGHRGIYEQAAFTDSSTPRQHRTVRAVPGTEIAGTVGSALLSATVCSVLYSSLALITAVLGLAAMPGLLL